jgi:hypothetical protein
MARGYRRHSEQRSSEGRFIASRIQDARRRGATNQQIADAFGINERTVRKIVSGETSGRKLYREHVAPTTRVAPESQNLSIVRLDLVLGKDANGDDIVRTVNARTPLIGGKTPTPFDVFRLPNMETVARAEWQRLQNRYAGAITIVSPGFRISSIRPIVRRDPTKRLVTITGQVTA